MPRKIRLNLVSPGPIDTPLLHRNPGMGPADVARLKEMMIANIPMHRMGEADGRIDVLFINAGIGGFAPLRAITEDAWDQVHSVNLKGCVFALQKALPLMKRGGSVVVTGSIGAHGALEGNGTYAAAKAGLYMAMKVFAKELVAEGIRVNVVSPGPIDTPLLHRNPGMSADDVATLKEMMIANIPMHRMGESEDVAKAVLFLASDDASFITGANLFVDGGLIELR